MGIDPYEFDLHNAVMSQQGKLRDYLREWARIPYWDHPTDRYEVERAVNAIYEMEGLESPLVVFCESLWQMAAIAVAWSTNRNFDTVVQCGQALADEQRRELWQRLKQVIQKQHLNEKLSMMGGSTDTEFRRNPFDVNRQLESKFKLRAADLFVTIRREALPPLMLGGLARIFAAYNAQLLGEPQDFVFLHQDFVQDRVVADVLQDVMHLEAKKISSPVRTILRDARIDLDEWLVLLPNHRQFLLEMGFTVRELAQAIAVGIFEEGPRRGNVEADHVRASLINTLSVQIDYKFWLSPWAVYQLPPYFFLIDCIQADIFPEWTRKELTAWRDLTKAAFGYLFFPEVCLVCERPKHVALDERGRLHSDAGPSLEFKDEYKQYFWHGHVISRQIVEEPQTITIPQIERERNAEIKRILIERYGLERFIKDSKAKQIHEDHTGVLFRKELLDDEPVLVVMVKNSTPEPDGTYKNYFLRVPPRVRTAKEAVAWTFGMPPDEYAPEKET